MIEVKSLFLKKGDNVYLNDISCSIGTGEITLVAGIPGSEKSLLMKVLAGMLRSSQGEIVLDDETNRHKFRKKIAYLPQFYKFKENISGKQFALNYTQLNHAVDNKDLMVEIVEIFTRFDRTRLLDFHLNEMTDLEFRIYMLLLLLCSGPAVLIIDEIQEGDVSLPAEFLEKYIEFVRKNKITTIISSRIKNIPDIEFDRLLLMHRGWLAYQAEWSDISKSLNHYNIRIRPAELAKYFKKYSGFEKAVYIEELKAMDVILKSEVDPYKVIMAFIKNNLKFDMVEIFKPNIQQFLKYKLEEYNILDEDA